MSLDLRDEDPAGVRFRAIWTGVIVGLLGCIVGLVAAGLFFSLSEPAGWLLVAAGASAGVVPIVPWLLDRGRDDHIDVFAVDRSLRPIIERAAHHADRIERAAAATPPGPVAEVLAENHAAALAHVRLAQEEASDAGVSHRPALLRVEHQLDELATSSEALMRSAMETQPTVLNALTERTELIRAALDDEIDLRQTEVEAGEADQISADRINAGSDEPDPADPGATTDH